MILCDAGPLYALVNGKDAHHQACRAVLPNIMGPLWTTWPCFAEAMHLSFSTGGWPMQRLLWQFVNDGILKFYPLEPIEEARMQKLMEKYEDAPMDLGDASLVAAAEALNVSQIFTLDKHFHAYRIHDNKPFKVIP